MVCSGDVTERQLGDHTPGSPLPRSLLTVKSTVVGAGEGARSIIPFSISRLRDAFSISLIALHGFSDDIRRIVLMVHLYITMYFISVRTVVVTRALVGKSTAHFR